MASRQRRPQRQRLPVGGEPVFNPARNTLGSTQLPYSAFGASTPQTDLLGATYRVPSPTESEEEETRRAESPLLGDSSSLFSNRSPIVPRPPLATKQTFQFGQPKSTNKEPFTFDSPLPSDMVVEREPPKATPQKPLQPAIQGITQPKFGESSPLQNRLQPNNVFNVPKPNQPRPEHHRPASTAEESHRQGTTAIAHNNVDPFRPHQTTHSRHYPDVVEIPRPANAPAWNIYPRPAPTFSTSDPPTGGFAAVNAYQKPLVDSTKPHPHGFYDSDAALLDGRFGAADPYMYVDAGKATENIKALLEGAFEDEEDKPRTRGRKKKVEVAVAGLTDKLQGLGVQSNGYKENHNHEELGDEEEEEDDGTVEGLKVKLLPHQVDGVAWMKDKEVGTKKKNRILPKGGILADDMGLGKTIQSIALVLTNPRPSVSTATSVTDKNAIPATVGKNTLVVAPLALIKQWEAEIKNRVSDSHKLRVCIHHGPQRTKRFENLKTYDVVITTYQILVSEHGSSSEREDGPQVGCFGIHWYRTILDEAHTIKNRNAKATKACYALRAEYRWCLTGTPMQNNLDELQSLIKFLRIKPYDDLSIWKDQITRPLSQGKGGVAMKRLQFYLKAFMKRRTKDILKQEGALNPGGKPSNDGQSNGFKITARRIESVEAEFSPEERKFYDRLEQRTDRSLEQMMGGQKMNYASALVLLLRLRQACNHPQLVGGSMAKDRDALTTGQAVGTQSPRKSKTVDNDIDEMADLLGGMSMQTKQCDVCQIELTKVEVSAGSIRCTECDEDLASQKLGKDKSGRKKYRKHRSSVKMKSGKSQPRAPKKRNVILDDTDEDENVGCDVPEHQHHSLDLGKAGGTDDEDAEGGGEYLASDDTNTEDDSKIKVLESWQPKVISLDTEDEEDDKGGDSSKGTEDEEEEDDGVSSSDSEPSLASITTSAKIQHLLKILHRESSSHKFIVFSQFTSMLDLIEPFLNRDSLVFTRYDGSMRNDLREASLERLRNNNKTRILLCSLKCGSLGLNLTAASRVVILEPFWNPFVEEQAIDRVHRLNQTLDVTVYKLTIAGTVEARILELQEKKRALANAAIEGKAVGKLSMKDILNLFKRDAEHDGQHDLDPTLGVKTKVLTSGDMGSGSGFIALNDREASRRVTPPVVGKPKSEDSVFARRW